MYAYEWDKETGGYVLSPLASNYVAFELRPVFAEELLAAGMDARFTFDPHEPRPLMWARKNEYLLNGEKIAQVNNTRIGSDLEVRYYFEGNLVLTPVDVGRMVEKNAEVMSAMAADAEKRAMELYNQDLKWCDIAYIAYSGGKDSAVLLDICHRVLPLSVPVVFSDTDMELPDSYAMWEEVKGMYPGREFVRARADSGALENWRRFGPPAMGIKWCCSVHKSTPALIAIKEMLSKDSVRVMAFVGVRGDESFSRSSYVDSAAAVKNASQRNEMPILDWGSHEVWLYIFARGLPIHRAYRHGIPRVGCAMCPESSVRYEWFVDKAYPGLLDQYNRVILETTSKSFRDEADRDEYLSQMLWRARKSGALLVDSVTNPIERSDGDSMTLITNGGGERDLREWVKTLGRITVEDGRTLLWRAGSPDPIPLGIESDSGGVVRLTVEFNGPEERKALTRQFKDIMRKSMSCVGCRVCEAECVHGALSFVGGRVSIDAQRCVGCQKCLGIDLGCWRFRSTYKPDTEAVKMSNMNSYCNFGIREDEQNPWITYLVQMGADFFPYNLNHPLGNKMVDSASKWFQQALLVTPKRREPTALVELFAKYGGTYKLGWEFIWMALANNSMLIKWFVVSTDLDQSYTVDELSDMILDADPGMSKSNIKGALASLKDTATKSPIGGEEGFIEPILKGKTVEALVRRAHDPEQLSILYGLYVIADKSGQSGFSVSRDFTNVSLESEFIPPTAAFGMPFEEFKKACTGLHARYPEYIELTFTHGNDGVEVFPDRFSPDDIVRLALED